MRRRTWIAAAWVVGATVPLALAALFIFGCCVLPFHGVLHRLAPICETAAAVLTGGAQMAEGHGDHCPATPAKQKQEPVKRIVSETAETFRLAGATATSHAASPTAATGYRSFITHGAARCDQDVGLHALVETFLI